MFDGVNELIKFFIKDQELAKTLKSLLLQSGTTNKFAAELRDRYLAVLDTKRDADAQTYLNNAHASRKKMAIPINNAKRNKGRHEGEAYVANFGMLPKDVAGVISVRGYYAANYATLECAKYDGNGDDNNRVDVDSNASMVTLRKTLPTLIVDGYNRTLDLSTHHLHAVKNDNAEKTTVSDVNVACLDKGTYNGAYKKDLNMLVTLLGLDDVLPVKKRNQATKSGRYIFQLAGLLGLIENVVTKWLATDFKQVHIMVCGSNAGALIGTANNSLITWRNMSHPENWSVGDAYFSNGNLYSCDDLKKTDDILKEWFIRTLRIINLPNDDENKMAMKDQLNAHEVCVTQRFGSKNLTEEERKQLPTGGRMMRQKAFTNSKSNGCIILYLAESNVTYVIGNNQTASTFKSSMWGNQSVGRSRFYKLKLSDERNSKLCSLDDGLLLQDQLNEVLDAHHTDQDVSVRLAALSKHGVVGYEKPKENTWEKYKRELESYAKSEGNWVNMETEEGDTKVLLVRNTAGLYKYVAKHFLDRPIEYLKDLDEWDDISEFNWHLHKSARTKKDGGPKQSLDKSQKLKLMMERAQQKSKK